MDDLYQSPKCPLPREPDRKRIDEACARIIENFPQDEHLFRGIVALTKP